MAKMGRPKIEEPMAHKISVRFTDAEYARLKAYAERMDQSMTDALKAGLELLYAKDKEQ